MNNKELLKNLSSLTLHAVLVVVFGLVLMSITAITGFAASKISLLGYAKATVVTRALELPFLLGILALTITESLECVKPLMPAVKPALTFVRKIAVRDRTTRRPDG